MKAVVVGGNCVTVAVMFTVCDLANAMVGVTSGKMIDSRLSVAFAFDSVLILKGLFWYLFLAWWCLVGIAETWRSCNHVSKMAIERTCILHIMGRGRRGRVCAVNRRAENTENAYSNLTSRQSMLGSFLGDLATVERITV